LVDAVCDGGAMTSARRVIDVRELTVYAVAQRLHTRELQHGPEALALPTCLLCERLAKAAVEEAAPLVEAGALRDATERLTKFAAHPPGLLTDDEKRVWNLAVAAAANRVGELVEFGGNELHRTTTGEGEAGVPG